MNITSIIYLYNQKVHSIFIHTFKISTTSSSVIFSIFQFYSFYVCSKEGIQKSKTKIENTHGKIIPWFSFDFLGSIQQ